MRKGQSRSVWGLGTKFFYSRSEVAQEVSKALTKAASTRTLLHTILWELRNPQEPVVPLLIPFQALIPLPVQNCNRKSNPKSKALNDKRRNPKGSTLSPQLSGINLKVATLDRNPSGLGQDLHPPARDSVPGRTVGSQCKRHVLISLVRLLLLMSRRVPLGYDTLV